ncbi:hypothetical protein GCM10022252_37710 [Streptosporangium oxazolinicum]|uniref:Uncharacterized protein n=1 Tax=Streptosporangium oxazolinicum TaxID=909287 RepID=A0ABP8B047_9ACTN
MKRPCAHAPVGVVKTHAASVWPKPARRSNAVKLSFIKHPPCRECADAGPLGTGPARVPRSPD